MSADKDKFVLMRINAAGYVGGQVSLIGTFDPATDILLLVKEVPYEDGPKPGFLCVTTNERDKAQDALFTEDETRDAITTYFSMLSGGLINLQDPVKRNDPANAIERDGMDESGMKYRIRPDITNGQYAVLLAAYYAKKQRDVAAMEDFAKLAFYSI